MNAARRGGGIGTSAPRTDRQMISFNSISGAMSASSRFIFEDACAPKAVGALTSVSDTRGGRRVNGAVSGTGWNRLYIAGAAASYWLIGSSPRINSIVRSTEDVV